MATRPDADGVRLPGPSGCLDCGAPGTLLELRTVDVQLAECTACGLVFNTAWPDEFDDDLYSYYATRPPTRTEEEVFPPLNMRRIGEVLESLEEEVRGRRLLDVGCGEGDFVRAAVDRGWDGLGLDLAEGAIETALRFGLPCRVLDVFDSSLDAERFDLIVMSEFIEHVPHPTAFLRRARELLDEGGMVYLTTPNYGSLGRRVLGSDWREIDPEHLSYFTPKRLERSVRMAGLRAVETTTTNLSMATLRRLTGRAVSRDKTGSLREDEQACREQMAASMTLSAAKWTANTVLNLTGLGESLKMKAKRA